MWKNRQITLGTLYKVRFCVLIVPLQSMVRPNKSIPTTVNERDGVIRCAGKFPMYGVYGRGVTFAHLMHFRYVCFAIVNPLIGH